MMDIYDMEKMLELGRFAEKIAAGVVDDQAYNVLTQTVNEDVIAEARSEVETILENGGKINGEINLEKLAKEVAEALPEAAEKGKTESKEKCECTEGECGNAKAKIEEKKCAKVEEKKCAKTEATAPANPAKPAAGMDTIDKFLDAAPVKQKDFVDANTNKEHTPSGSADKKEVDKNAETTQKEMVKDAEAKKKFEENVKTQTKVNLTESVNKFKVFVESIRSDENSKFVDAVLKGVDVIWK